MNDIEFSLKLINYLENAILDAQAMLAFQRHKAACEEWNEGFIVKYWKDEDGYLCVAYESGEWWHYKDLDLPFPTWW